MDDVWGPAGDARCRPKRKSSKAGCTGRKLNPTRSNADAQFTLGTMYKNGDGVPQDYAEAVRWYRPV